MPGEVPYSTNMTRHPEPNDPETESQASILWQKGFILNPSVPETREPRNQISDSLSAQSACSLLYSVAVMHLFPFKPRISIEWSSGDFSYFTKMPYSPRDGAFSVFISCTESHLSWDEWLVCLYANRRSRLEGEWMITKVRYATKRVGQSDEK